MKVTAARRAALDVLRAVRRGELADPAFERAAARVPARDRGWFQELTYGTLRLRGRMDALLAPRVRRGLDALDDDVLDVLRLGAYQLVEMRSVPAYAAVSQSVELAKRSGRGAAALVNGVLHALARDADRLPHGEPADPRDPLASHPAWLVERWIRSYGLDAARDIVAHDNTPPDVFLRPIGVTADAAADTLAAAGIETDAVAICPDSLRLRIGASAAAALAAVPAVVQDPAAALVVRFADVPDGGLVADLCAAPGGKTMELAERARYVVACDLSPARLRRVAENRVRLGAPAGLVASDARTPALRPLDAVLVDAPCTGTGTLRRHPDGKWRLREADVASLARLQAEILEGAAGAVRPGGLLVYATCSLEPEENADRVNAFLETHTEFAREATGAVLDPSLLDARGDLVVLPHLHGTDGAYAARLRRRAA